jgi:deoxyribose-phosphate aldolase
MPVDESIHPDNKGCEFNQEWIQNVHVIKPCVEKRAAEIKTKRSVKKQWQAAWLLRTVNCIDLTTLAGDDSVSNVERLCFKAVNPVRPDVLESLKFPAITCGAVCVYPSQVKTAKDALKRAGHPDFPVASVATGFPAGQTHIDTRLAEIRQAVSDGASEIDVVISRTAVMSGKWKIVYDEVKQMKEACGDAHMKTILAIGECGSYENVHKASMVSMMAGSDFIKTSTGKEGVNATLAVSLVMVRAIREYHQRTGMRVGFKPAGGIRSAKDALSFLALMKEELGDDWLNNNMFRIGASSLLTDCERQLFHWTTGHYAAAYQFPMS